MNFCLLTAILGCLCFRQFLQETDNKPLVTVFYEPLCPYSKNFIINLLYPTYRELGSRIHLDLIPYGNVNRQKKGDSWTFKCQHGPDECAISKLQGCGIAKADDENSRMEYIYCMQKEVDTTTDLHSLAKCANKLQLTENEVLECAEGPEGNKLFGLLGDKQQSLAPNMSGVPTVFINSEVLNDKSALKKTLCHLLNNEPEGCKNENDLAYSSSD